MRRSDKRTTAATEMRGKREPVDGVTARRFDYLLLDVFTTVRLAGNPLAVFPSADGLSDAEMQAVARELNLSETVFFRKPRDAKAATRIRIFTPRRELDFAGHPTIGSACVIAAGLPEQQSFIIEENVGLVPIELDIGAAAARRFWLITPAISFLETRPAAVCARLLNLSESDLAPDVEPQLVTAGSPLLFVCLRSVEAVDQQQHSREAFGAVDALGTFVFAIKAPGSERCFDVYSRMFAPHTGIPEDPATGGATGPLAAYMLKYGLLPTVETIEFRSEQGVKMERPSELFVRVERRHNDLTIKVGGSAVTVAEGTFLLD